MIGWLLTELENYTREIHKVGSQGGWLNVLVESV